MGFIVKWAGGTAYVGDTGRVEGVDGDIWPLQKPLWMLKRMLKHRKLDYTIKECKEKIFHSLNEIEKEYLPKLHKKKVEKLKKEIEEPLLKEPVECKS